MIRESSAIDVLLAASRADLERVDPADLAEEVAKGALLVDIRPAEQRQRDGEFPGAVVIDRNVLEWRLDPSSPWHIAEMASADRRVIIVCNEGYSSSLAAATLRTLGLRRATDLVGGFQAVLAAGPGPALSAGQVSQTSNAPVEVFVGYNEALAKRIRKAVPDDSDNEIVERKMFGGLAFFLNGNMFVGVVRDELMVRLGEDAVVEALGRPHVREMDFTGRPMKNMIFVQPAGLQGRALGGWVLAAVDYAKALPPKAAGHGRSAGRSN